eukprot:11707610-Alexandrium_andersonii.AAC.1
MCIRDSQRATASDKRDCTSTLQATTNRSHRQARVSNPWKERRTTPTRPNSERTTRARPVGATGRGMAAGA